MVDNTPGDIEQGWELVDASSIETDGTDPATEKSSTTRSYETISPEQIAAGGTGWILLDAGFVGNDGTTRTSRLLQHDYTWSFRQLGRRY